MNAYTSIDGMGRELTQHEIAVNDATRREFASTHRAKHDAIIKVITGALSVSLVLLGAMRFPSISADLKAAIPFFGILIAVASAVMVRIHRRAVRKIEWQGSNIECFFENNGVHLVEKFFVRPDSVNLKFFTIPMIAHLVMVLVWIGFIFMA